MLDAVKTVPAACEHPRLSFARSHAFVVGIDDYRHIARLETAVGDAQRLGELLEREPHGFIVHSLLNPKGEALRGLLRETLPQQVGSDDRVVFYFAGHGIGGKSNDEAKDAPAGYLVPSDGLRDDPSTWIPMEELHDALDGLKCRHLLLILDCCFSGAFKWSRQTRGIGTMMPRRIYKERFDRFIKDPAWQVITSAAHDQKALDVLDGRATGHRGVVTSNQGIAPGAKHSPFARALIAGLLGDADLRTVGVRGDGLITATELYSFIRDAVEPFTIDAGESLRQTPSFFPFARKHGKGEFIFLHPSHPLNLDPSPPGNPYKGLNSFDIGDEALFYGRSAAIAKLHKTCEDKRLIVLSGASGTGKSSVVKAGLLPRLRAEGYFILDVMRPGFDPVAALHKAIEALGTPAAQGARAVLVIDQFEELITRCTEGPREAFLGELLTLVKESPPRLHRIVVTVRSDFEPQFHGGELGTHWKKGLCAVTPFNAQELKEVILLPAIQAGLFFEPESMVDDMVNDVVQARGPLPLLSYALSQLYEAAKANDARVVNKADLEALGGVVGSVEKAADSIYRPLSEPDKSAMRKLMLRMVSVEGDLASRRIRAKDLRFSPEQDECVARIVEKLDNAGLIVKADGFIEPAHDALVRVWKDVSVWIEKEKRETLALVARLAVEAAEYRDKPDPGLLWYDNPKLADAKRYLKEPNGHILFEHEVAFIRLSESSRLRQLRARWALAIVTSLALIVLAIWANFERLEAVKAKERTLRSLFTGLKLRLEDGKPGTVCAHPKCPEAPKSDKPWTSLAELQLPEGTSPRDFMAASEFGKGHVLIYGHDGLVRDGEMSPGFDNLQFSENALRWVTPVAAPNADCVDQSHMVLWEGTYATEKNLLRQKNLWAS